MGDVRPLNEITREGIRVLCRELGVVDTARFINHFTTGYGNYTEEREQLFSGMSLEDIVSEIKRVRDHEA
jgi:hypothetical protein